MSLSPSPLERLNRARADLRMGLPVVLTCDQGAALVIASESLTPRRLADLRALCPQPILALTGHRAQTLKARAYDGDVARVVIPADAGIDWIEALADPADDLRHPMKGPLKTLREGPADLHRAAIRLVKSAQLLPAAVLAQTPQAEALAAEHGLTQLTTAETETLETRLSPVIAARLPMRLAGLGRLHVFRPDDGGTEHYAIEVGQPDRHAPVLARLHSRLFAPGSGF